MVLTVSTVTLVLGLRVGGNAPPTVSFLRLNVYAFAPVTVSSLSCSVFLLLPLGAAASVFCVFVPLASRLVPPLVLLFCVLDEAAALALSVGGGTQLGNGLVSCLWVFRVCVASLKAFASSLLGGGTPAVAVLD